MTKDLALLIGPDQKWLTTTGFLDKVDENLKKAMAAYSFKPHGQTKRPPSGGLFYLNWSDAAHHGIGPSSSKKPPLGPLSSTVASLIAIAAACSVLR
jgi:hypothetical protein